MHEARVFYLKFQDWRWQSTNYEQTIVLILKNTHLENEELGNRGLLGMLGARHSFNSATFTRYLELANMAIAGGGAPAPVAVTNEAPVDSPPEQADPNQQRSPPEQVSQWNAVWGEQSST